MVDWPNEKSCQANEFNNDDNLPLLAPKEDHEASMKHQRIDWKNDAVQSALSFFDWDDNSQKIEDKYDN